MNVLNKLVAIFLFGAVLFGAGQEQQKSIQAITIDPVDVRVVKQHVLDYPPSALNNQGIVVIRVKLDKSGRVTEAEALSGNDVFIPDTINNVKTWEFQPNASGTAIVIYNFRIAQGQCKTAASYFEWELPNLVNITACRPASSSSGFAHYPNPRNEVMVSDKDMEALDYEDMRYPPSALLSLSRTGIVVLQAELDENGKVISAFPLMGGNDFTPECLENVKKWRFRPNAKKKAVIVYRFNCLFSSNYPSESREQSVFYPPNYLTVSGSPPGRIMIID